MNKKYALAVSLFSIMGLAVADEGMWTIDNFPRTAVRAPLRHPTDLF
jgi:hypothetical protein